MALALLKLLEERDVLSMRIEGASKGDLKKAKAHWILRDTIAWDVDVDQVESFKLHFDPESSLDLNPRGVVGGTEIVLTFDGYLRDEVETRFPHMWGFAALKIAPEDVHLVSTALKGQLAISALDRNGKAVDVTSLQIPGVLDDLFAYDGPLGVVYEGDIPSLQVWAPTARSVTLHLFDGPGPVNQAQMLPMEEEPSTGVWHLQGAQDWTGKYYLYEVEVYVPSTARVERNLVTDPYSLSLATNGTRSQIVDLRDPDLMPDGWTTLEKPALDAAEDVVIYELHVRDFSVNDPSVPPEWRGTYLAFTGEGTRGMEHLRRLANAGLTHVHLLPVFDIATINENKEQWEQADFDTLASFAPDSEEQQRIVSELADRDGYNWGYDPLHYTAPEGSYATDPNGPTRIVEFRRMVQGLNQAGLRVVMDVVYNHTHASGQSEKSVLDRLVPGYYHRLDDEGNVETSTCCANTATEHVMMRKLMVDSLRTWATAYKVDGFRFDLMGHHMVADMVAAKEALHSLSLEQDGVDGSQIYLYGEGWNFGEVANNARGVNATQLNLGGLGIGTFNDRIRDAVRGGSPFGGSQEQGFINGLYYEPNSAENRSQNEQKLALLELADQIRVGLAGNLADFVFVNWQGQQVSGADVEYNGAPTGYTQDPQEHIPYISAHDNETLFDATQYKAPESVLVANRARMQNLGLSIVALSQGVPFFHAGVDMLRSKSFDRDSFDSGDWFNKLDFAYQDNNFGAGLPPAEKNRDNWPLIAPLLGRTGLKPAPEDIIGTCGHFREVLQMRKSSPLFRLRTAAEVQERLRFHNIGSDQVPGLIVMSLADVGGSAGLDPDHDLILVVFNATPFEQRFALRELSGIRLVLHPVQAASADGIVKSSRYVETTGTFIVPARTSAVFVALEGVLRADPFAAAALIEQQVAPDLASSAQPDPATMLRRPRRSA